MKGIVFNLLEHAVTEEFGEDSWDEVLEATGLDGAYTAVGSYPDEEFLSLVSKASAALGMPPDDLVRWFGRKSIPVLYTRYPQFFDPHTTARSFVLTLNEVIHPEVRKLFPGADVPVFDFDASKPDRVTLGYVSSRKLCAFAEGLIEGAAVHFGEQASIEQTQCMKRGDAKCVLDCSFKPLEE
ncbi:MAG: heme NO-binding domain-containing protein [Actinomycetota bacterium]